MRGLPAFVLALSFVGCATPAPGESRFPAAEPAMPLVTYYDPQVQGPLGPPIHDGSLIVDPPPEELPPPPLDDGVPSVLLIGEELGGPLEEPPPELSDEAVSVELGDGEPGSLELGL